MLELSLVDTAEAALRERLAPGRARPGDRLPPEKQLAESLGVSRGTLRLALERLESNGEIVRRQGSGTFVGRVASPAAFSEGLEVLESYASPARRQGKRLSVRDLRIERAPVPGYVAEALGPAAQGEGDPRPPHPARRRQRRRLHARRGPPGRRAGRP